MRKLLLVFSMLLLSLSLTACYKNAESVEEFRAGDIKDDFCGVDIDFRYCKCAFHGEYCDAIGMKKSEAKKYVEDEYEKWLDEKEDAFKRSCEFDGGNFDPGPGTCVFCKAGTGWSEKSGNCVVGESDDEATEKEEIKDTEKEEKEEEKKPASQADCDGGTCYVNGDCLPMLIECKGGAFMKPWGEVCALAAKYVDGQPLSTEICYCHGNYCYIDQQCQEMKARKFCGDSLRTRIKNPTGLCVFLQKESIYDDQPDWKSYCECSPGYCELAEGNCEKYETVNWCDDINAHPKGAAGICAAMKLDHEKKPVNIFDWCECDIGYTPDRTRETCVKSGG